MKFTLFILATLLSVTFLGTSAKYVKFINHCPYNIYFWAVGPPASHIDGGDSFRSMVPGNGGSVIDPMVDTERFGGGLSLKIRDLDYYTPGPAGIIQVEYNLEESKGNMWYDLSAVDCDLHAGPANPKYCRMYFPLMEREGMQTNGVFSTHSRWCETLHQPSTQQERLPICVLQ